MENSNYISGAHSTGKSTIIEHLPPEINRIQEVARSEINKSEKLPQDMNEQERFEFQLRVILKQIAEEYKMEGKLFVADRAIFDMLAYSKDLHKRHYDELYKIVSDHIQREWLWQVFYTPIEFPMKEDGIRPTSEKYRQKIDGRIQDLFEEFDVIPIILRWTVQDRVSTILSNLNQ